MTDVKLLFCNIRGLVQYRVILLNVLIFCRYSQFYWEEEFCHYNMFNHHFFGGEAAKMVCQKFLQEEDGKAALLVTDPPFGGLVEPLAFSFKRLREMFTFLFLSENESNLPILWMFPYFFESRILQCFPDFTMLHYQVDYDNLALYKHGKTGRRQSPVRIFTDIPPDKIVLPAIECVRSCRGVCEPGTAGMNASPVPLVTLGTESNIGSASVPRSLSSPGDGTQICSHLSDSAILVLSCKNRISVSLCSLLFIVSVLFSACITSGSAQCARDLCVQEQALQYLQSLHL
uniref:Uncharacterized protein n=1 Tax=Xenopus tropicalis TaxID=8364 RepID=A0A6I8SY97_XENTR